MKTQNMFNLLRQLDTEDYTNLIAQVNLASKGYELFFAIDADLIGNYCFPKGIIAEETRNERLSKLNSDYLADEQITLHTLFYLNDNHKKLVLLNQYYFEVERMLYKADKVGSKVVSALDFNLPTFKIDNNHTELLDLLYNSFSTMYAKVLLHINGLKKISSILNDKKLILDSKDLTDPVIQKITDTCIGSKESTDAILDIMQKKLWKNNEKKYELFPSRRRDAKILDRLFMFNCETLKLEKKEKNKIFILLSDSTFLKGTIKLISENGDNNLYPLINNEKISFYRNIPQSFAYLISLEYDKENKINFEKTIKNLEKLKETSKYINKRFDETSEILELDKEKFLAYGIFENYNRLRNAFENSGLLKSFEQLLFSIKDELNQKGLEDVSNIFYKLKNDGKSVIKEIEDNHLTLLKSLSKIAEFNTSFVYGLEKIKSTRETFDLSKGSDYIEGHYHHLPMFITFPKNSEKHKKHMDILINLILNHNLEDSKDICEKLEEILFDMTSSSLLDEDKTEINLIKSFLFMILPSIKLTASIKENDQLAFDWIKDLRILKNNVAFQKNKLYLKIWASRRIQKYNDSLVFAAEGIKLYPSDPRFIHGSFLANYCIMTEKGNLETKNIDVLLQNLTDLNRHYPAFVFENFDTSISIQILKAIRYTYSNSFCYCLCLKAESIGYENNPNEFEKQLEIARSNFLQLKDGNNQYFEQLPEYYDTEALLEYLESFYVLDKIEKLNFANSAITNAINLSNNDILIKKYYSKKIKIENRILGLNI